jgi:hypothetical protein
MSKIGLVIFLVLMAAGVYAQQDYFVLIHSENNLPFYVRMGGRTTSSSAEGHLILSGLKDSTWMLAIGFPRNLYPEQDFSFSIKKKDIGFQLKDLGLRGWGLFNSQTMELIMPQKKDTVEINVSAEAVKKDDAFSRLMAAVVSDTAVMYSTYAMEAYLKDTSRSGSDQMTRGGDQSVRGPDSLKKTPDALQRPPPAAFINTAGNLPAANMDTSIVANPGLVANFHAVSDSISSSARTDSSAHTLIKIPRKSGFIEKLSEKRNATAIQLVFADHRKGHKPDTIGVNIAIDSLIQLSQNQFDTFKNGGGPSLMPKTGAVSAGLKTSYDSSKKSDGGQTKERGKPVIVNSDCRNFATEMDVDKLKLRLQNTAKDDDRILEARKIFRMKCFSTRQVRAIAAVFATDAGRYRFLETAYPFVSDNAFRELSDLLTDPVYTGKFKTMTGQ